MPVTNDDFLTDVIQSSNVGEGDWVNLQFTLELTGFGSAVATSVAPTQLLSFSLPLSGSEIPPEQVITWIKVTLSGSGSSGATFSNISIADGNDKTTSTVGGGVPVERVIEGNLGFWGITEDEAQDFANFDNSQYLKLRGTNSIGGPGDDIRCYYAKVQFTYEPASFLISAPVMF